MATNNWMETPISCFRSIGHIIPNEISLKVWLESISQPTSPAEKARLKKVTLYRETGQDELKKGLPAFCPSAILVSRDKRLSLEQKVKSYTGLMQFDIDRKDNLQIKDFEQLRDLIFANPQVAYCSLSTSGKGVWGLILVSNPDQLSNHFRQLTTDFMMTYGLKLDTSKGSNPTDLRYYTFDPEAKIKIDPKVYTKMAPARPLKPMRKTEDLSSKDQEHLEGKIRQLRDKGIDIAPDYETFRNVGFALASEFGESGREMFHQLCELHPKYDAHKTDIQYNRCLSSKGSGITMGTLYHLIKQHLK